MLRHPIGKPYRTTNGIEWQIVQDMHQAIYPYHHYAVEFTAEPTDKGKLAPAYLAHKRELGGRVYISQTNDWDEVNVQIPIPAPRDGKTYTWQWSSFSREWRKSYFDLCAECRQQHSPRLSHCLFCGKAMKNTINHCRGLS